jgi:hypothetical protein
VPDTAAGAEGSAVNPYFLLSYLGKDKKEMCVVMVKEGMLSPPRRPCLSRQFWSEKCQLFPNLFLFYQ